MGTWKVDGTSRPGVITMRLEGVFSLPDMQGFVRDHNAAIDARGNRNYRVFVDIRELKPLSPECAQLMESAKAYSNAHRNFQGSAVLVASKVVALQHQRTSTSGGVMGTELISDDEAACWAHLERVHRS